MCSRSSQARGQDGVLLVEMSGRALACVRSHRPPAERRCTARGPIGPPASTPTAVSSRLLHHRGAVARGCTVAHEPLYMHRRRLRQPGSARAGFAVTRHLRTTAKLAAGQLAQPLATMLRRRPIRAATHRRCRPAVIVRGLVAPSPSTAMRTTSTTLMGKDSTLFRHADTVNCLIRIVIPAASPTTRAPEGTSATAH